MRRLAFATHRKEGILKRTSYSAFYHILQKISDIEIPLDSGDFCCFRRGIEAILGLPERNRFIRGIRAWVGFTQVGVPYEREAAIRRNAQIYISKAAAIGV